MQNETKLILIKSIHTLSWLFFNVIFFCMAYTVLFVCVYLFTGL